MSGLFGQQLQKDNSVEESKELVGSQVLPSGVYKAEIVQAYMQKVPAKAGGFNFNWNWKLKVTKEDGSTQEVNINNIFIAKEVNGQIQYFYEKDGKKTEYPAFSALNRNLKNAISVDIFSAQSEQRNLPVYNFQTQKEEPTAVTVIPQLFGLEVAVGLMEVHQNKRSDETKLVKFNTLEKVWRIVNGNPFTFEEVEAGLQSPENYLAWDKRWTGVVNDRDLDQSKLSGSTGSTKSNTNVLDIG